MAREFEQYVERRLLADLREEIARRYIGAYTLAKPRLAVDIYSQIQGVERNLSDHSEQHIDNVLHNARRLLPAKESEPRLTGIELYCLSMFILFHDVGNLFGRHDHRKRVGEVYDWVRGTHAAQRHEKTLVLKAAQAHTGVATDGSYDTLKELNESDHLDDNPIRLRELAAILRFADELAEGPQRTSEFMRVRYQYSAESQMFHDYASITHVNIDRPGGRVRLTYEVDVTPIDSETDADRDHRLAGLLEFAYKRIQKLDQERRYARYYSESLAPFRLTSVEMNFHADGRLLPVALPSIQLDEKVVPGDPGNTIDQLEPAYRLENLLPAIAKVAKVTAL